MNKKKNKKSRKFIKKADVEKALEIIREANVVRIEAGQPVMEVPGTSGWPETMTMGYSTITFVVVPKEKK